MEESYTYLENVPMSSREEVICGIEEDNVSQIIQDNAGMQDNAQNYTRDPGETFQGDVCEEVVVQEEVPETIVPDNPSEIMYLSQENVLTVMQQAAPVIFQDNVMVQEEVITDDWVNPSGEERIDLPVNEVGSEQQIAYDNDNDIPLPTDQDEYTASRPYPCDFCSRRFRKKANLMNHMVAHQTDRPHGCNLCGARYIRKCDLMNHLKIHAYIPDQDELDDELLAPLSEELEAKAKETKPTKAKKKKKSPRIKQESESETASRSYNYIEEDVRLLNNSGDNQEYDYAEQNYAAQNIPARYPILDARKPFVCQHCGVAFAREKALASHARIHAGDSPFECETCSEMFWDVQLLREHVRAKHGGNLQSDYEDLDDGDYIDDENYGEFYCTLCGIRFHRQDLLRRHLKNHDNVKDEFNEDQESGDNMCGHVCNVCGQSFSEALDLLAHAEIHARNLPGEFEGHRCMLCGEVFTDETSMANHVSSRHGKNMPPNTCMLCGRTCKDRRTLLKHSWEHSREKLFSCSKCGKSFHNKARLKRHMVSHRNKAVQCDICGEDFPDGRSLMNHRHSHSNISGRQFPCRECGKTFGSRSSQQIHIRIHTGERPYGCRFCWKAFADGGTLRKHERIHTGEKPYACAVCPRAFNQRVVLREHIRSHHSGPDPQYSHTMTPYCCSVCNDMFSTSQDLIIHLIHHCDMNTAMKRQPQVGPRKYKRRRKLKPHELELLSNKLDDEIYSDEEPEPERKRRSKDNNKKISKKETPKSNLEKDYESVFESFESAVQTINSIVNSKPKTAEREKRKKFVINKDGVQNTRPKMIHTQKTRVPVDPGSNDGKRHKTKTLITRTTPQEAVRNQANERNRPRTKNVSYVGNEKPPLATFGDIKAEVEQDPEGNIVENQDENLEQIETEIPDIASEETVLAQIDSTETPEIKLTKNDISLSQNVSLTPGRHIIGPGNKVVRIVKGGMIVRKKDLKNLTTHMVDTPCEVVNVKQEIQEPSPLHELAELSMQHAQNQFRCEMCSATFNDRSQLLMHVPIHI